MIRRSSFCLAVVATSIGAGANAVLAREQLITGTGFAITSDGFLITNEHVVEGCAQVQLLRDGRRIAATVMSVDTKVDLALLKVAVPLQDFVKLRSAPAVRLGEQAISFGYPLAGMLTTDGNLTIGNVSALRGPGNSPVHIQVTTPIQAGNSGGPMLDASGNLVGVTVAKLKDGFAQNVNFAISVALFRSNVALSSKPRRQPDRIAA